LGTTFLLAAVVGSGIMAQKLAGGNVALALLCNTLPTGAILVVLILVFGPLSGGHFNPVVSIAFALRGKVPWSTTAIFIVTQILGAIGGVWMAHLMFDVAVADIAEHAEHAQHTDINTTRRHCIVPSVDLTTGRQTACRASPGKEEHAVKTAFRAGFGRVAGALCNPLKLLARRKRFELLPPNSKSVPSV
jgi:glycerol uptake facilitator-like aquaporin